MNRTSTRFARIALACLAVLLAPNSARADHAAGHAGGGGFAGAGGNPFARDAERPSSWLEYGVEIAALDRGLGDRLTHTISGSAAFALPGSDRRALALRAALPITQLFSQVERDAYGVGDLGLGLWWSFAQGGNEDREVPVVHLHEDGSEHVHMEAPDWGWNWSLNAGLLATAPTGDRKRGFGADAWGNGAALSGALSYRDARYGTASLFAVGSADWAYEGAWRPTISWSFGPMLSVWEGRVTLIFTTSGASRTGAGDVYRAGGDRIAITPGVVLAPFVEGPLKGLSFSAGYQRQVRDRYELRTDIPIPLTEPELRSDVEQAGVFSVRYAF